MFYLENEPIGTMKTSVSKTHRIRIFPKGLVYGFGQNFEICLTFRFRQNVAKKRFRCSDVLVQKQAFLDNRNMDFKKKRKIGVDSPSFWSKN